jgi:hypothetical protein
MAATSQGVIFSLECTLMMGASILGVYFSSLFLQPIVKASSQIRTTVNKSKFTFRVISGLTNVFGMNFF